MDFHPAMLGKDQPTEHQQLMAKPEFVKSVLGSNKLFRLRCFDDLTEEQAVQLTLDNLEITQNPNVPEIYKVQFFSNLPDNAQTIVNNLLSSYRKDLEQTKFSAPESESTELVQQPDEKTTPKETLAELEFAKRISNSGLVPGPELQILEPATYGEPVWPLLPIILLVTGLIGILVGFAIIVAIFMFSKAMSKQPLTK